MSKHLRCFHGNKTLCRVWYRRVSQQTEKKIFVCVCVWFIKGIAFAHLEPKPAQTNICDCLEYLVLCRKILYDIVPHEKFQEIDVRCATVRLERAPTCSSKHDVSDV